MTTRASIWQPRYTLTPAIARALMKIEAARAVVENMVLPPAVETELRHRARVRSTHYSTRIEGNRLTLAQAEQVVEGRKTHFHGRERDVSEVRNYWNALLRMEAWAAKKMPVTKELGQRGLARGRAGIQSRACLRLGGKLSAIYRQFIGNRATGEKVNPQFYAKNQQALLPSETLDSCLTQD